MFDFLGRLAGPWTVVWGMILAAVSALETMDWATIVPPGWEGFALALVGAVTALVKMLDPGKPGGGTGTRRA